ncbi:MAG: phage scaffolding protein, partial [Oscillospiraceae bacterium]|nr:phage scaffolding protein [Oscillospiraceae bacterium]
IKSYKDMDIEGVKQSVKDWETKYNTDTKALKDQLDSVKYGHAVDKAVGSLKFTSESARKAFVADLTAKKLQLQDDGKLLGLEDFTKTYREADPGAFAPAQDEKIPVAVRGGGGGNPLSENSALRAAFGIHDKY